ncbi:MAG TPA: CapA family protein [Acidimicrobiia bacterium]|nr:CapA family protein [Acidimicrobiia bacterium]
MPDEIRIALAGDTMLGRGVAEQLRSDPLVPLLAPEVVEVVGEADLFILNLECCISERGEPWPDPRKPFFFRAPPVAAAFLGNLGVDCVTLANNHALDFGPTALVDTLDLLAEAGVAVVGAGRTVAEARRPVMIDRGGFRLQIVALTDHPRDYDAGEDRPGVAYADLGTGVPGWALEAIGTSASDAVLVSPHWGPNMTGSPVPHVRRAAAEFVERGAALVAGHSAHVFHGASRHVLYDLGDFLDDYAVDPVLRNDLGMLFLVDLSSTGPRRVEAVPLALDYCHTRLAAGDEGGWIRARFARACAELGTEVHTVDGRVVLNWADTEGSASVQHP